MEEIRGIDILVSVETTIGEYTVVGGQRGATLNRAAETMDATNKITGDWKRNISGLKEWSVDCDGLLALDDVGYLALEEAFNEGKAVKIQVAKGDALAYEGDALITDFPIEAPYDDLATYSVSFTGAGPLVKA